MKSHPNILHLVHSLDPRAGGVTTAVLALAQAQRDLGHRVTIAHLEGAKKITTCAEVIALGPSCSSYGYTPQLTAWLKTHKNEFDAIVVHGLWQYHSWAASTAIGSDSPALYVYPHGMLDVWFKKNYPFKHLKKTLYWNYFERAVFEKASGILFSCHGEMTLAEQTFLEASFLKKSHVVGLGILPPPSDVNECKHAFARAYPQLENSPYILYLGRLHPKKGVDLLVEAWKKLHPREFLVLAGPADDPRYSYQLKNLAEEAGRIVFMPMLEGPVKWGALAAASYLILPSHQENFGMVLGEALAVGTPVCTTTAVNIAEEIEASGAAYVAEDTPSGIYQLLEHALSSPPAAALRVACHKAYGHYFSATAAAEHFLNLL